MRERGIEEIIGRLSPHATFRFTFAASCCWAPLPVPRLWTAVRVWCLRHAQRGGGGGGGGGGGV